MISHPFVLTLTLTVLLTTCFCNAFFRQVFDHSRRNALVGTITGMARGVFTLDFAPPSSGGKKLVVGGGDSSIRVVDIEEEEESHLG